MRLGTRSLARLRPYPRRRHQCLLLIRHGKVLARQNGVHIQHTTRLEQDCLLALVKPPSLNSRQRQTAIMCRTKLMSRAQLRLATSSRSLARRAVQRKGLDRSVVLASA